MSTGGQKKTRLERVAALEFPPNPLERLWVNVQRFDVLVRIGLCVLSAVFLWVILGAWAPPFSFRTGFVTPRDIVARVEFHKFDPVATARARDAAAKQIRFVYQQNSTELQQLRGALKNALAQISAAGKFDELKPGIWQEFSAPPAPNVEPPTPEQQQADFQAIHDALACKEQLEKVYKTIDSAFAPLEQKGIIDELPQPSDAGNQDQIFVHPLGSPQFPQVVQVSEVRTSDAASKLHERLRDELGSKELAQRLFYWIKPKLAAPLVPTLQLDRAATESAQQEAREKVPNQFTTFSPGHALAKEPLVEAGHTINQEKLELLELEHKAFLDTLPFGQKVYRSLAFFGMLFAMYTLSGFYIQYRAPSIYKSLSRFSALLCMFVAAVAIANMASDNTLRAESVPIMLFGMTVALVYHQELALLLTAALVLVVAVAVLDEDLSSYITLMSAATSSILLLGRVRSRTKLIYVGIAAAVVGMCTEIGDSILAGQPLRETLIYDVPPVGWSAVAAGFLMTGLLPFIEKAFGVLTDISLLEIGDISHPLLQELVRRAPGTYNHSINVAAIGEAAADAIGARGLLVRVGAYFHDIGKMLKPQYFAENQGQSSPSLHETLLPAMSRLIIVAHVKDGADLARQHHLPKSIIDFIEQHHGTTLVEYFFRRAEKQSAADPTRGEVEEHSYRYPGPKPQSKEAGVLMLADAAESASRSLVDPAPARLEGLIRDIAMNRLLDGQFDDCALTLQDLHTVEQSLVKSLIAVYHGRVRYPDQKTA
jgi:cyclic-di-AMP phosphodiesterase PgpH